MARAVGIDLGTTNSVVAVLEGGEATVIANSEGARTTPSVVAFKGDERLVGQIARRQAALNPQATLFEVKRFIGRRWDEVHEEAERSPFKVKEGPGGSVRIEEQRGTKRGPSRRPGFRVTLELCRRNLVGGLLDRPQQDRIGRSAACNERADAHP